jgi:hypothetical protein
VATARKLSRIRFLSPRAAPPFGPARLPLNPPNRVKPPERNQNWIRIAGKVTTALFADENIVGRPNLKNTSKFL